MPGAQKAPIAPDLAMATGMHRNMMARSIRALARALAMLGAGFALLTFASLVTAEEAAVPPDAAREQAAPSPALPSPPGVVDAIGRFIDQSISNVGAGVGAGVKGAGDTIGGATTAAGDIAKGVGEAAGSVAKLPLSNVAAGWERCAVAPNGAPDCNGASVALCKSKGFAQGSSLDITSSQKCPAQMWREGRAPNPQECTDESFVSRAICQ
jgi:hypothetical protein